MKKILSILAAVLLCVTISAQTPGGQGGPGGMPPGGMGGPGGQRPMGPPPGDKKGKKPKEPKEPKTKTGELYITVPEMYMYAVGVKDGDSMIYVSDILTLKNVKIQKKTGFLTHRSDYSSQFKKYLASKMNESNRTCAVSFSKKRNKLVKEYDKLMQKYSKRHFLATVVFREQFEFIQPED